MSPSTPNLGPGAPGASGAGAASSRGGATTLTPTRAIGRTRWAIAEGYIAARSTGPEPEMLSHETACILNAGERDAHVAITIYYADHEPTGPYRLTVPARRTR